MSRQTLLYNFDNNSLPAFPLCCTEVLPDASSISSSVMCSLVQLISTAHFYWRSVVMENLYKASSGLLLTSVPGEAVSRSLHHPALTAVRLPRPQLFFGSASTKIQIPHSGHVLMLPNATALPLQWPELRTVHCCLYLREPLVPSESEGMMPSSLGVSFYLLCTQGNTTESQSWHDF